MATTPTEDPKPAFHEEVLGSLLGSSKEEILQKLGPPLREFLGADKSYLVYRGHVDAAGFAFIGVLPIPVWGEDLALTCSMLEFGTDQRLTHFETYEEYSGWASPGSSTYVPSCEAAFWSPEEISALSRAHWAEVRKRGRAKFEKRAHEGDPDAMYEYANYLKNGASLERLKWYCLAAQAGHSKARYQIGRYHHHGYVIEENALQAYVWYSLALKAEDDKEGARQREKLSKEMTPAQIAEAERLVAEWEPNPAECEKIGMLSEN